MIMADGETEGARIQKNMTQRGTMILKRFDLKLSSVQNALLGIIILIHILFIAMKENIGD